MSETFTCAFCGDTNEGSPEDEAIAEYEKNFGKKFDPKEVVLICDDCYKLMTTIDPPPGLQK